MNTKPGTIFVVLAVLAVAVILSFVLLQKPTSPASATAVSPTATPVYTPEISSRDSAAASTPAATQSKATPDDIPAWETQIDQVLRANVTETQTAQILLNILPTLPEDGQVEAANHVTNLLPDEDYALVKPVLLNPNLPESVLSVFFTDLMNRNDAVKLRSFLDLAKIPNHPFHEEALNDLQIYLGDDFGSDWPKWNAALEQYLKTTQTQ